MDKNRETTFEFICQSILMAYTDNQKKIFEHLMGFPISSVTVEDMKNYKKNRKLWEVYTNIRNGCVTLSEDGSIDVTHYKKIDVEEEINKSIDKVLGMTKKSFDNM